MAASAPPIADCPTVRIQQRRERQKRHADANYTRGTWVCYADCDCDEQERCPLQVMAVGATQGQMMRALLRRYPLTSAEPQAAVMCVARSEQRPMPFCYGDGAACVAEPPPTRRDPTTGEGDGEVV